MGRWKQPVWQQEHWYQQRTKAATRCEGRCAQISARGHQPQGGLPAPLRWSSLVSLCPLALEAEAPDTGRADSCHVQGMSSLGSTSPHTRDVQMQTCEVLLGTCTRTKM